MDAAACKVLVVDDNRDAADAAVMLIETWGHEALAAYSGADCLAIARVFDPDVVLMDIGLPGRDGFAVARDLEKLCPGVRIVALTGFTQADIIRRSRADGFADFLTKPVEGKVLRNVVEQQCGAAKRHTKRPTRNSAEPRSSRPHRPPPARAGNRIRRKPTRN